VRVCTHGEPDAVRLEVHNFGPPIPPELLPFIFNAMQRGHESPDRGKRSFGLGLFIVYHIVRAHDGSVLVSSSADEGTTFTVRLPRKPAVERGAAISSATFEQPSISRSQAPSSAAMVAAKRNSPSPQPPRMKVRS
jgi:hypothetical protein